MKARLWLGCMGWQQKDWTGSFYPAGTKTKDMLALYSRVLPTVEVDSTFYGRPRATTIESWLQATPGGFRFALKVPSEVTHRRRFREAEEAFSFFVERVRALGSKLGAVLLQCPPDFKATAANRTRLFSFLESHLPSDIKVALELRDPQWYDGELFALARAKRFALVAAESEYCSLDLAAKVLQEQGAALDFAYLRWMGSEYFEHYDRVQADKSASLDRWVQLIRGLGDGVSDVYGYVSDDYEGHSPATVRDLLQRLGEPAPAALLAPRLL